MHPKAQQQRLDLLIGILGVFTLMAFVSAVARIVRGDPGLVPSLVLALFAVLSGLAILARRRVGGR